MTKQIFVLALTLATTSWATAQEEAPPEETAAEPTPPLSDEAPPPEEAAPAADESTTAAPAGEQEVKTEKDAQVFYKGELGSAGAGELESPNNSFFVGVGIWSIDGALGDWFLKLTPELNLRFDVMENKKLKLSFEGPFNIQIAQRSQTLFAKERLVQKFRSEDYDHWSDWLKLIKQVQLGRKEDRLYINVGRLHGVQVGHGTVMSRYAPNIDPNLTRLGVQLDAYNDFGGFESFVADLGFQSRVMGGLVFVKPLKLFSDSRILGSLSIGGHATMDLAAPTKLKREGEFGTVIVDDTGYPTFDSTRLTIAGVDLEMKPLKLGNFLDLKVYGDYSMIMGAGSGMSGGLLLRSNLGSQDSVLSALRVRMEARQYAGNYRPHYFDSLYEIQKLQMVGATSTRQAPTKYAAVVEEGDAGKQLFSWYGEAAWSLVDYITVGVGVENLATEGLYNFLLHAELPALEFLRFFASYQKLGFADLSQALARVPGQAFKFESDAILTAQARLMVLPILFVNGGIVQAFQWDPIALGGSYKPELNYVIEAQFGWEFD